MSRQGFREDVLRRFPKARCETYYRGFSVRLPGHAPMAYATTAREAWRLAWVNVVLPVPCSDGEDNK